MHISGKRVCAFLGPGPPAKGVARTTVYPANQPVFTPPVQARTSAWAIASLICGIFGFIFPCLIVAIVFGIIALKEVSRSNGAVKGHGLALAGLIISGMWVLLILIGIIAAIVIPMMISPSSASSCVEPETSEYAAVVSDASEATCRANLTILRVAMEQCYLETGAMPPTLQALVDAEYIGLDVFACSACGEGPVDPSDVDSTGAYGYDASAGLGPDSPRIWSKAAGHSGRACVLYAGGTVDTVAPDVINAKLLVAADAE